MSKKLLRKSKTNKGFTKRNEQDKENEEKVTRQYVCTARNFLLKFDEVMRSLSEVKNKRV